MSAAVPRSNKVIKKTKGSKSTQPNYTVEIILAIWNDDSDYGKSFR